jgi:hypothetical protein
MIVTNVVPFCVSVAYNELIDGADSASKIIGSFWACELSENKNMDAAIEKDCFRYFTGFSQLRELQRSIPLAPFESAPRAQRRTTEVNRSVTPRLSRRNLPENACANA